MKAVSPLAEHSTECEPMRNISKFETRTDAIQTSSDSFYSKHILGTFVTKNIECRGTVRRALSNVCVPFCA